MEITTVYRILETRMDYKYKGFEYKPLMTLEDSYPIVHWIGTDLERAKEELKNHKCVITTWGDPRTVTVEEVFIVEEKGYYDEDEEYIFVDGGNIDYIAEMEY